jgi:hypothetical protein
MPTDTNTDALFESDDPKNNRPPWGELTERATKCPGIAVLDRWIDESLEELENEFCEFSTQKSMRRNFGR